MLITLCGQDVVEGRRGHLTMVSWGTNKLKRVARSSLSAEVQNLSNTEDELHLVRAAWHEISGGTVNVGEPDETVKQVPGIVIVDAKSIYDTLTSRNQPLQLGEKHTALELFAYLKNTEANDTQKRWVHGEANLADGFTKQNASQMLRDYMLTSTWAVVRDFQAQSGKKRKAKGLDKLEVEHHQDNEAQIVSFNELLATRLKEVHPNCFPEPGSSDDEESDYTVNRLMIKILLGRVNHMK